jgi:hypothetical protein
MEQVKSAKQDFAGFKRENMILAIILLIILFIIFITSKPDKPCPYCKDWNCELGLKCLDRF